MKKEISGKSFYRAFYAVAGVILVILGIFLIAQLYSLNNLVDKRIADAKEAARPADIQLSIIDSASCRDCYDIAPVVALIKSSAVNITDEKKLDISSEEAKKLISDYGISEIPSVIITGEIDKSKLAAKLDGSETRNSAVFTKPEAPFIEVSSGKVRGKVTMISLKKDGCEECFNLTSIIGELNSLLKFESRREVNADSSEGKNLIDKYKIKKIPALILDKEAGVYPAIAENWNQVGTKEEDGSFIIRQIIPPYYSVDDGRIKGRVTMTTITDKTCASCYEPVSFHKPVLKSMGVFIEKEDALDASTGEGKALIDKYKIEKLPTMILRGDTSEYPLLTQAWRDVGTIEADGAYVFRKSEIAQKPYKNLISNTVIAPENSS